MPNCLHCSRRECQPGVRSYGWDIPAYAQGAYFPGDEPREVCTESDVDCVEDQSPMDCPLFERSFMVCPECYTDHGELHRLYKHEDGDFEDAYECPSCGETYHDTLEVVIHALQYRPNVAPRVRIMRLMRGTL